MSPLRSFLLLAILLLCTGAAKKPDMSIRFYAETNEHDTERFGQTLQLGYPPRKAFLSKTAVLSERNVVAIYVFEAANGTSGCLFKLDEDGRIRLSTVSIEKKGTSLVAMVTTKRGTHQVIDMLIDKPVNDGIITIQQGLTPMEVIQLEKEFRPLYPPVKRKR